MPEPAQLRARSSKLRAQSSAFKVQISAPTIPKKTAFPIVYFHPPPRPSRAPRQRLRGAREARAEPFPRPMIS